MSKKLALFCVFLFLCPQPVLAPGLPMPGICVSSCTAALTAAGFAGGAALALSLLGFTSTGVVAGSWAAWFQATFFGGSISGPSGAIFSALQSMGATGSVSFGSIISGAAAVCGKLCSLAGEA